MMIRHQTPTKRAMNPKNHAYPFNIVTGLAGTTHVRRRFMYGDGLTTYYSARFTWRLRFAFSLGSGANRSIISVQYPRRV